MSRRVLGLLLFAVGLAALVAGFQIVALVSAATGLLFIASSARRGRGGSHRSRPGHAGSSAGYYYGDHRNDDDRVGGSDGDSGGAGGGDGGGGGGGGGGD